ncbi:undecaprenyl-diphosphatase [Microvirga puerhi]|uniref:Undecaprenyl-diphosphatase n=1 Tax=Microvirga puerhi TaxID=2876078 RepID=A0ABS7VTH4_9HYPH|nr:undecaprenyl-diphosphatase [Microvirga puerhi]MBZ6078872.1 undecaprenyl-diphosphatase [Microvirga puerhi]
MESWNDTIFLALNAPERPSHAIVLLAIVLAQWAIFLIPALLAALWLWGNRESRTGLLLAALGAELALAFNQVIALLWYHPRPFAVPTGHTLLQHVADSSFPSDHVTFLVAVGFGLLAWIHERWAGPLVLLLAASVAWARLYLGVHFPFDMLGAVPIAAASILIVMPFRAWVSRTIVPRLAEPLYRRVFSVPIERGWVRP